MNPRPPDHRPPAGDSGLPPPPPGRLRHLARIAASLLLGLLVGVLAHYLIYRFSLPSKPFVYVTF